jgi:hypothetical protein
VFFTEHAGESVNDRYDVCKTASNTSLTTVFLFLVTRIVLSGIIIRSGSKCTRMLPVLCTDVVLLMVIALLITVSVGDHTWQDASGGTTPDMWVVAAGFKDFTTQFEAQAIADGSGMKQRIFEAVSSVTLGLVIHICGCYYY